MCVFVLVPIAILMFVLWGYHFSWTGFGEAAWPKTDQRERRHAKTLWDWLGLLVVPLLLAGGGYWFTYRREKLARELEMDRLREEALQGYLDRMTELMLDKSLGQSKEEDPVRDVARSATLLTLRRLDSNRKGILLSFLRESELIVKNRTIIRLNGANLRGANLFVADLWSADLAGANLRQAILTGANLRGADLRQAILWRADLAGANLAGADLAGADLIGADLAGADLREANLGGAILAEANLREADLGGANLRGANLFVANLWRANLGGADLRQANLAGADLRGADLRQAILLTPEQLTAARGDAETKLPAGRDRSSAWTTAAAG